MQFYFSVMFLRFPDDMHEEKRSFLEFKKNALPTDQPTDGRTDRPTDGRTDPLIDVRTHLKILYKKRLK